MKIKKESGSLSATLQLVWTEVEDLCCYAFHSHLLKTPSDQALFAGLEDWQGTKQRLPVGVMEANKETQQDKRTLKTELY